MKTALTSGILRKGLRNPKRSPDPTLRNSNLEPQSFYNFKMPMVIHYIAEMIKKPH